MKRNILILVIALVFVGCGRSKPIEAPELVGSYVYKWGELEKPANFEALSLRADGTYTLSRTNQPKEHGQWKLYQNSPMELGLGTSGYAVERHWGSIRIIGNPDLNAWFEKTSNVPKKD